MGQFQVGRSHECDFPAEVSALPVCTRPAIEVSGSSAEIDRLVKQRVSSALSVYEVDAKAIARLRPTHIITQTQCKVCAVSLDDVEKALQSEMSVDARVISLEPYKLDDLWLDIGRIAVACGVAERGLALVASLEARMAAIAQRVAGRSRPTVAAVEWLDPLMAAGNWVPELIEMAHGTNLFGVAGRHSPWMTWEQLAAADPDIIVALPCGFDLARTRSEMGPQWRAFNAKIFICDGNQFMNRPGPRLVESLQIFAEILHPELFPPALEHIGWEYF